MSAELVDLNTFDNGWLLFNNLAESWVQEILRFRTPEKGGFLLNSSFNDQLEGDEMVLLGQVEQDGCMELSPIGPGTKRRLIAVDGSVVLLGFVGDRALLSLKAAVVERDGRSIRVRVVGPMPKLAGFDERMVSAESVALIELRRFEATVQKLVARTAGDALLLFDMPLTRMPELTLSFEGTTLIGIAKNSVLAAHFGRLLGRSVGLALLARKLPPDSVSGAEISVTVARLAPNGLAFRADVMPADRWIELLSDLVASDALISGYPETLAMAHAFSRHSWTEVVASKTVLEKRLGLKIVDEPDVRGAVLLPFDGR
jgi:hypothetical protein